MKPVNIKELCTSTDSIATAYAKDTSQELSSVVKNLRKEWAKDVSSKHKDSDVKQEGSTDRLELAATCGKFPGRPSDLFLKVSSSTSCR